MFEICVAARISLKVIDCCCSVNSIEFNENRIFLIAIIFLTTLLITHGGHLSSCLETRLELTQRTQLLLSIIYYTNTFIFYSVFAGNFFTLKGILLLQISEQRYVPAQQCPIFRALNQINLNSRFIILHQIISLNYSFSRSRCSILNRFYVKY